MSSRGAAAATCAHVGTPTGSAIAASITVTTGDLDVRSSRDPAQYTAACVDSCKVSSRVFVLMTLLERVRRPNPRPKHDDHQIPGATTRHNIGAERRIASHPPPVCPPLGAKNADSGSSRSDRVLLSLESPPIGDPLRLFGARLLPRPSMGAWLASASPVRIRSRRGVQAW